MITQVQICIYVCIHITHFFVKERQGISQLPIIAFQIQNLLLNFRSRIFKDFLTEQNLRWEFIKENKKVKKKENTLSTKKKRKK